MESKVHQLDQIAITVKSHMLLKQLSKENPVLEEIMRNAKNPPDALVDVRNWVFDELKTTEGRMDEVFRSITIPDTVQEAGE